MSEHDLAVIEAMERLERLDDLNESRQSDGSGAAHFFGDDLRAAMDRFHADWSTVRDEAESLRAANAALTAERDEAREQVKAVNAYLALDLNGQAIMEARGYLNEHLEPLGAKVDCAFFGDCIHNAVAFALIQKAEVTALLARQEELREALERIAGRGCLRVHDNNAENTVWDAHEANVNEACAVVSRLREQKGREE